jgi:hypothetical protein
MPKRAATGLSQWLRNSFEKSAPLTENEIGTKVRIIHNFFIQGTLQQIYCTSSLFIWNWCKVNSYCI